MNFYKLFHNLISVTETVKMCAYVTLSNGNALPSFSFIFRCKKNMLVDYMVISIEMPYASKYMSSL